jgi:hypothetical protein
MRWPNQFAEQVVRNIDPPLESNCRKPGTQAVGFDLVCPQLRGKIDADPIHNVTVVYNEQSRLPSNPGGRCRLTCIIVQGLSFVLAPPTYQ